MKKIQTISLFIAAAAIVGCNGLGKMAKNASTVKYEVKPNPLEMHGDSVAISVSGSYPPKYFAKKVTVTATPVLKTSNGEKSFKPVTMVGEKVKSDGTVIKQKEGGSFSYTDKIAYTSDMRAADVMLKVSGSKGTTIKEFPDMKIADATIATPAIVKSDEKVLIGKDNFKRITPVKYDGKLYYPVNVSKVNPNFKLKEAGVTNKTELAALDSIIKIGGTNSNIQFKGIDVVGYASPDGAQKLNADLSTARGNSGTKYVSDAMKKNKMNVDDNMFHVSTTAEDWPGFQQLMQESDMAMKDVILRIVSSNSDVDAREMEIKKMGKAYKEIATEILPKLRRSTVTINADKVGRSDEQILALATSNPDSLSVEEILYAGTLTTEMDKKLAIYTSAERIYPQDWRCANNAGMVKFMQKDVDGAMAEFNKADLLNANNAIVMNNLGACYRQKGDRKKATELYTAAMSAGSEVGENMAIIDIQNGNYSAAVGHCGSANTFNCALGKLLSGDKDGALATLNASPDSETAIGLYLKAVISARKNDATGVVNNLKSSIAADSKMKEWASTDREFIKWFNDAGFKAAVQ